MQIGFSSKLIADYTEMVNNELDKFKIHHLSGFKKIEIALSVLLEKNEIEKNLLESNEDDLENKYIKCKINSLKELIDNPDLYVENPNHFEQFKTIVKTRIQAKIIELNL